MRSTLCFILNGLCCLSVFTSAQGQSTGVSQTVESRRDELIRERKEKLQKQVPEEQRTGIEKALLKLEAGAKREYFQIRYKDIYPKIGAPEQGGGFGGGIRYFKQDIKSSGLTIESQALWSVKDYRVAEVQFGRFTEIAPITFMAPRRFHAPFEFTHETPWQIKRPRAFIYGDFKYHYYPQMAFYGLGLVFTPFAVAGSVAV